jgi:hypothetical protein
MRRWSVPLALLLAACSSDEPPPAEQKAPAGRAETQSIRNTEAVGYSGDAVADKVDDALKKNEERAKQTQPATEQE